MVSLALVMLFVKADKYLESSALVEGRGKGKENKAVTSAVIKRQFLACLSLLENGSSVHF